MATTLKEMIAEHAPLVVPSIYDGISALLVREMGFEAAYVGSYATGATRYGLPDVGYIGLEDMADQTRRLAPIVGVPLIVDGESGWGNPVHVARAIRVLEQAGAAATHIEDHKFGKHITVKSSVVSVARAVDKLKAGLDARHSDEFMIIARTDASGVEGPSAAVDRLLEYQAVGADGLFLAGTLDAVSWARLSAGAHVPIFVPDLPRRSGGDLAALGADVVLYYGLAHVAAKAGMLKALEVLRQERSTMSIDNWLATDGFDAFLGIEATREEARKYGLISKDDNSMLEALQEFKRG